MSDAWVFAYGSNMNIDDLRRWLREHDRPVDGIERVEPALLGGYQLAWNYKSLHPDGGAANIEMAPGRSLPGLALAVNETTLHAIDKKEGHPHRYCRGEETCRVGLLDGGEIDAWVYEVKPDYLKPPPVWPRRAYLNLMVRAAKRHGLPEWYIGQLESTPTCD